MTQMTCEEAEIYAGEKRADDRYDQGLSRSEQEHEIRRAERAFEKQMGWD